MGDEKTTYSEEDLSKAAQAAFEEVDSDEVGGFAMKPQQRYGQIAVKMLDNLSMVSGGRLIPGCCTQGCCKDG